MSILNICTYPSSFLKKKSVPVTTIDRRLHALIEDMCETMFKADGVGLAAPQVGINLRLIVIDGSIKDLSEPLVLINPEILFRDGEVFEEEGCLSIPKIKAKVVRANRINLRGLNYQGKPVFYEEEGLMARVFQHEMDHLEGILFWDRIDPQELDQLQAVYKKKHG